MTLRRPHPLLLLAVVFAAGVALFTATNRQSVGFPSARAPAQPRGAGDYVLLADRYMQRMRDTGDASYYVRAGKALRIAQRIDPRYPALYTSLGTLALARHDSRAGPASRLRAHPLAPAVVRPPAARVDVARGRLGMAIHRLRGVLAQLPLPEYVIALGDAELAAGRVRQAHRDLALVGVEQRLLAANGVNTDTELAVFEADHGSPTQAVGLARRAWANAPSVRSADALGWALTADGHPRAGLVWARRALGLGSRDPLFLYHAGM